MIDDMNEFDGVDDDDPCLVYVSNIILRTMKIKHDKWARLMATIEYKVSVFYFLYGRAPFFPRTHSRCIVSVPYL